MFWKNILLCYAFFSILFSYFFYYKSQFKAVLNVIYLVDLPTFKFTSIYLNIYIDKIISQISAPRQG